MKEAELKWGVGNAVSRKETACECCLGTVRRLETRKVEKVGELNMKYRTERRIGQGTCLERGLWV